MGLRGFLEMHGLPGSGLSRLLAGPIGYGKLGFGFCGDLLCFVVDSWVCWDCRRFPLVFTAFCGADFLREECGEIVVNVWLDVDTKWLTRPSD